MKFWNLYRNVRAKLRCKTGWNTILQIRYPPNLPVGTDMISLSSLKVNQMLRKCLAKHFLCKHLSNRYYFNALLLALYMHMLWCNIRSQICMTHHITATNCSKLYSTRWRRSRSEIDELWMDICSNPLNLPTHNKRPLLLDNMNAKHFQHFDFKCFTGNAMSVLCSCDARLLVTYASICVAYWRLPMWSDQWADGPTKVNSL